MKNLIYCLAFLCLLSSQYSCKSDSSNTSEKNNTYPTTQEFVSTTNTTAPFTVQVTEDSSRTFLPSLQSFVLATSGDTWLMFAGRTNGMHDFADYTEKSFPHMDFNTNIYVCDASKCDSMSVTHIPMPYQNMFRATNLQHYQDGNDLYITGGYGENPSKQKDILERWDTYSYMAKIDVADMMSAVSSNDTTALNKSIVTGQNSAVEGTGGELFKMGDYFYQTVGHKFNGIFSHTNKTPSTQVYLDAVHRFKISEVNDTLAITNFTKITDGFADDSTQFRRRDLPVVTSLQLKNGILKPSLSLFAGVFTSPSNKIPGLVKNQAFSMPIYVYNDGSYQIDQTYQQKTNVYAAANFSVYDSNTQVVHSTILGGIGDNTTSQGFTNNILTISTPLAGGNTIETVQGNIPTTANYYGAESNMIYSSGSKVSGSDNVFDISNMKSGDTMNIGQFYGGIQSNILNPGGFGAGKSQASNKVWSVTIKKN